MADNGMAQTRGVPHVVVVGGGVAGLAAAFFLRNEPVRVTVLEGSSRIGGQLAVSELAGTVIDEGAESTYARRPKTARLLREAGLDDRVVSAGTKAMGIRTGDAVRPLPDRQFMGVPCDMDELAASGILSEAAVERAREDAVLPMAAPQGDVSVAEFVGGRFGREVVDRLVDPFLADAYFGRAEELSLAATLSPLVGAARRHPSLAQAAGALIPPLPEDGVRPPTGISTLVGGLGRLPRVLADALLAQSPGSVVRTGAAVRTLARGAQGWRLGVDGAAGPGTVDADAVVLAAPAGATGRLLAGLPGTADATAALAAVPHAGSVIITLAYPRDALAAMRARGHSGYRVPAVDGRPMKVVTFSTVKWPHMAGEVEIVRCQAGGSGDGDVLGRDDADLVALAAAEVAGAAGVAGAPVASRVTRWADAVPQYTVGHLDRVERIRASVAAQPSLAVCGALYDGVGIGQCVVSALKAVDQVLDSLREAVPAAVPAQD
ncbi:putative protoporphyrinogen oxidase [Actinacidiphila reveromycinica]|uniref:Coproporphyrinogen III oxidase n=1 Tax=Actinacidiphila reveromycinica TaxID=659352 RepID=A0A7U3VMA1_9ACTN|nr:protoporphyrinogen oxidase [Streptomyces sp. SN-593]BBA96364.1 putative protoporphyrinogen oxidase [Streptomyces sp. SN-593]